MTKHKIMPKLQNRPELHVWVFVDKATNQIRYTTITNSFVWAQKLFMDQFGDEEAGKAELEATDIFYTTLSGNAFRCLNEEERINRVV